MKNDYEHRLNELEHQVAELKGLVNSLSASPTAARSLIPLLRKYRSSIERLERRSLVLSSSISACSDRLDEMRRSRTWQTLITFGGWLLRITGFIMKPSEKATVRTHVDTQGNGMFWCDEPVEGTTVIGDTITVRGWFLSSKSISSVAVAVAGSSVEARLGLARPDVAKAYPSNAAAAHCGYEAQITAPGLKSGRHFVEIAFRSGGRCVERLCTSIALGSKSAIDGGTTNAQWHGSAEETELVQLSIDTSGRRPLVSVLMPVHNPDPRALDQALKSLLAQSYPNWELCIADDASDSSTRNELESILALDSRIRVVHQEVQGGIATASNACLAIARGEVIVLLDQDDELVPHALLYVVDRAISNPSYTLIYSDEDKITAEGYRYGAFFKPDWSPDLIRSMNYVGHLLAIPKSLLVKLGGFSSSHEGSQDYDLVLRASEQPGEIIHIPRVLYHWRAVDGSVAKNPIAKPFAHHAARKAISDHLARCGETGAVEATSLPGRFQVRYATSPWPLVTIIIPSGGHLSILRKNLESLAGKTLYPNFEIVVVDNSSGGQIGDYVSNWSHAGRTARYLDSRGQPFNYAAINNAAARTCSAPLLLFLNDDVEVISPDWLQAMVELAARPPVGAVGAKLLYPEGRLQHAGVTIGVHDCCVNSFQGVPPAATYFDLADVTRNVSAVTGACLLTRSDVFWEVGGFDEIKFPIAFNDIDLCLKIGAAGYRILYTPHAVLHHHESYSKRWDQMMPSAEEIGAFRERWWPIIEQDPFYSPWLTRRRADFSVDGNGHV